MIHHKHQEVQIVSSRKILLITLHTTVSRTWKPRNSKRSKQKKSLPPVPSNLKSLTTKTPKAQQTLSRRKSTHSMIKPRKRLRWSHVLSIQSWIGRVRRYFRRIHSRRRVMSICILSISNSKNVPKSSCNKNKKKKWVNAHLLQRSEREEMIEVTWQRRAVWSQRKVIMKFNIQMQEEEVQSTMPATLISTRKTTMLKHKQQCSHTVGIMKGFHSIHKVTNQARKWLKITK